MYTLIATAELNDIDPQAWLAGILARIADAPPSRLPDLLPSNRRPDILTARAAWTRPPTGRIRSAVLSRSTDRRCRRGAPVVNLPHGASLHSPEGAAPSKPVSNS
jgi:hypothetical protein